MQNKSWFSLIEVLISAVIIAVWVFGIMRLASNNSSNINKIEKIKDMDQIAFDIKECLKSMDFTGILLNTWKTSINFWADNNECQTWSYNDDMSFSWILSEKTLEIASCKNWSNEDICQVWDSWSIRNSEYYWYFLAAGTPSVINFEVHVSDWMKIDKEYDFTLEK